MTTERLDRRGAIELAFTELQHVSRFQALIACAEGPSSAKSIADGGDVPKMAFHVRVLVERGLIKQSRKTPVRGAVETFYVATPAGRKLVHQMGLDGSEDAGA